MKKIMIPCAVMIACAMLQACGPSTTPEPTSTAAPTATVTLLPPPATPPLIDMLSWLMGYPFSAATADFQTAVLADETEAPIAAGDLPVRFIMSESRGTMGSSQDGDTYLWSTTYLHPVDGTVSRENEINIRVYAYSNEATRDHHFDVLATARQAFLQRIDGYDVLGYYDRTTAGHIWISGPYVIIVGSGNPADGNPNSWLSMFSEYMVILYPPDRN